MLNQTFSKAFLKTLGSYSFFALNSIYIFNHHKFLHFLMSELVRVLMIDGSSDRFSGQNAVEYSTIVVPF